MGSTVHGCTGGKQSSQLGGLFRSKSHFSEWIPSFMDALLGEVWPRMARTARYERNSRLAAFLTFTIALPQYLTPTLPAKGQRIFYTKGYNSCRCLMEIWN
jgi:hypothetical protein